MSKETATEKKENPYTQADLDAQKNLHLLHDRHGKTYALIDNEYVPIKSDKVKRWVTNYLTEADESKIPKQSDVRDRIAQLDAIAASAAPQTTYSRYANIPDQHTVFIGLGGDKKRVVKCTSAGWGVLDQAPDTIPFIYKSGALEIPEPIHGGSLDDLRSLLNIPENEFCLAVGWSVTALLGCGPYSILYFIGPKGSSKSTATQLMRQLTDPVLVPVPSPPKSPRDLQIVAHNNSVVVMNNVSAISDVMSDTICAIATEGGYVNRTLFSDDRQTALENLRPIIINGITQATNRPDFLERSIRIQLPEISPDKRRYKEDILREFNEKRPAILGVLLDGVCSALANYQSVQLIRKPRMADFLRYATAAETGLGLKPGTMESAYWANQEELFQDSVEASATAMAIIGLMKRRINWQGTVSELLNNLTDHVGKHGKLPATVNQLRSDLERIKPLIKASGIDFERLPREANKRPIRLTKKPVS